jgi:hypothetical protein
VTGLTRTKPGTAPRLEILCGTGRPAMSGREPHPTLSRRVGVLAAKSGSEATDTVSR